MPADISALARDLNSPDAKRRTVALAGLIQQGPAATNTFRDAFQSGHVAVRLLAAQGLAELADPSTGDALVLALNDPHPQIRARAAQGLARMNHPMALGALVQTINDFPDVLHHPYTLSANLLIQAGVPALAMVAPLLKAPDPTTRTRAFLVVRGIVSQLPEGRNWEELARSLGAYVPSGPEASRVNSAELWQKWISHLTADSATP